MGSGEEGDGSGWPVLMIMPSSGMEALTLALPVPRSWLRALLSAPSLGRAAHRSTPDPSRAATLRANIERS